MYCDRVAASNRRERSPIDVHVGDGSFATERGHRFRVRFDFNSGRTFLHNHAPHIAAMDLFVVPTIGFNLLYVLVIIRLARRELVWINTTAHPTAGWAAQQITGAFLWNEVPRYLVRL